MNTEIAKTFSETPTLASPDMRGFTRITALARIVNAHSIQENYHSDLLLTGAMLAFNDLPCAICVRKNGFEIAFNSSEVRTKTTAFGDGDGIAEWYIGKAQWLEEGFNGARWLPGDSKTYSYVFERATSNECFFF